MAGGQYLNKHQRSIVNRFYAHADTRTLQNLQEILSDLSLCTDEKAAERLWKRCRTYLAKTDASQAIQDRIVESRDIVSLADIVAKAGRTMR